MKLIPSYKVGKRDSEAGHDFVDVLAGRSVNRVQISSDGPNVYVDAVAQSVGFEVDYAEIAKYYEAEPMGPGRYSAAKVVYFRELRFRHYLHVFCGKARPDHADADAPLPKADQCLQQEAGEPERGCGLVFCPLQLYQGPQDLARHASDGGRNNQGFMEGPRHCLNDNGIGSIYAVKSTFTSQLPETQSRMVSCACIKIWIVYLDGT